MVEAEEKETILVSMMVTAMTTALPVLRRLFRRQEYRGSL